MKEHDSTINEKQVFLAIDLGTTNSSIAMASLKNGELAIELLNIPQMDKNYNTQNLNLLPSFAFFEENKKLPKVGFYAKEMMETNPDRVIHSVKSYIGKNLNKGSKTWIIDEEKHSPESISAEYLKMLKNQLKLRFSDLSNLDIGDIVITVPASFDSDMQKATLKAAELANIKVQSEHPVLLPEPRATLFDFLNEYRTSAYIQNLINLSGEKIIMVYDIGGGTTDVSIHKVLFRADDVFDIAISDIGISRYTNIAGDNFDEFIREYLYNQFLKTNNIKESDLEQNEAKFIRGKLQKLAETIKLDLSREMTQNPEEKPENHKAEYRINNFYKNKPFFISIDLKKYTEIVAPLLMNELTYPRLPKEIDEVLKAGENNIIAPIYTALKLAHKITGEIIIPDLTILTGGMVKFPLIKNRINDFINSAKSETSNPMIYMMQFPDLSVSRGAAIYHYYLHRGFDVSTLVSEDILFEAKNGLTPLIKAGTIIAPGTKYIRKFSKNWCVSKGIKKYKLPLYRTDKNHPLFARSYWLSKSYPEDTPLTIQVLMDSQKILDFKVWIEIDGQRYEEMEMIIETNTQMNTEAHDIPKTPQSTILQPDKMSYNEYTEKLLNASKEGSHEKIKSMMNADYILNTQDPSSIIEYLIEKNKNKLFRAPNLKNHLRKQLSELTKNTPIKQNKNIYNKIVGEFQAFLEYGIKEYKNNSIKDGLKVALDAMRGGKLVDPEMKLVDIVEKIIQDNKFKDIRIPAINYLEALDPNTRILDFLLSIYSQHTHIDTKIAIVNAISHQISRNQSNPILISKYEAKIMQIISNFQDYIGNIHLTNSIIKLIKEFCNKTCSASLNNVTKVSIKDIKAIFDMIPEKYAENKKILRSL
jgi:molecular chaperone DnaK (HSP70)